MSEIDVQNAKQIRDAMTVLITMEVPDDEVTLTYSGYSSAKVADGALNNDWPMRGLADLQGDGFPLDGSRVLYDPNTTASAANGKIGIRSNIGEPVSVTVTGNRTITSLSIFASGAESVTFGGTTTPMIAGSAVIPVGAQSITLTLSPASSTERIEVSEIRPGTVFRINNDNLIRAVVSLRSDLSIINPTLPESEINIDVYQDTDISEIVASIPEDTPITYSAGYPGDMSPERKFYVTGQVTWADNVLSIQGVDAVHFLDWDYTTSVRAEELYALYGMMRQFLNVSGVVFEYEDIRTVLDTNADLSNAVTRANLNVRGYMAQMTNLFHQEFSNGAAVWIRYVDGGRPSLMVTKPFASFTISESDCGDLTKVNERTPKGAYIRHMETKKTAPLKIGTAEWIKNVGASLSYDSQALGDSVAIGFYCGPTGGEENRSKLNPLGGFVDDIFVVVPASPNGDNWTYTRSFNAYYVNPSKLTVNGVTQNDMLTTPPESYYDNSAPYAAFVPWDVGFKNGSYRTQAAMWDAAVAAGVLDEDATSVSLDIGGSGEIIYVADFEIGEYITGCPELESPIYNSIIAKSSTGVTKALYPQAAYQSVLDRSPITYSFTWKGDPRMQPRDVVEWIRLDGTPETITLENITLTHEKGGTVAEITARKGIV